jgi:hypothetical protein
VLRGGADWAHVFGEQSVRERFIIDNMLLLFLRRISTEGKSMISVLSVFDMMLVLSVFDFYSIVLYCTKGEGPNSFTR